MKNSKLLLAILLLSGIVAIVILTRPVRKSPLQSGSKENTQEIEDGFMLTEEPEYDIVTLLPKDAISSIDNPSFYSAEEADEEYDPNEMVLGVEINGESKAYSTAHLDSHEIVNDELGGRKIAVTW